MILHVKAMGLCQDLTQKSGSSGIFPSSIYHPPTGLSLNIEGRINFTLNAALTLTQFPQIHENNNKSYPKTQTLNVESYTSYKKLFSIKISDFFPN